MGKALVTEKKNGSKVVQRNINVNTSGQPWFLLLGYGLQKGDTVELTMNKDGISGSFRKVEK